ncbi:MAG: amidohydrolase family protein [Methanomassiliicoccales archaeon]|nr:amidohydrolase family protein [Methanomassiliicoccales archaeon]
MKSILVRGAHIVTQNETRQILKGDILIEGGRIAAIGEVSDSADEVIDARGDIVMPGLVNAHTHVAMTIMKGVADDLPFNEFLERSFAIDAKRTGQDVLAGARLGCLEMIQGGTTTFVDMYYAEDAIAKATAEAGLRGVLCWAVLDQEYTTQKGVPLDNCKNFHSSHQGNEMIIPGIGLQGVYVCSKETFLGAKELADQTGMLLHFHLSETRKEVYDHKKRYQRRPANWLQEIGFLGKNCLAAHSAWLTINEINGLARSGCSIATCPVSNMKLATGGVAPIPEMMQAGVNVSIGTDGSTTNNSLDMLGEMKTLALLQKANRWDPTVLTAQQALDFATLGGARAIGLDKEIGSIEIGKRADLAILEGKSANLWPLRMESLVASIVYCANAGNVKSVICAGKLLMLERKVLSLNEAEVLEESRNAMSSLLA